MSDFPDCTVGGICIAVALFITIIGLSWARHFGDKPKDDADVGEAQKDNVLYRKEKCILGLLCVATMSISTMMTMPGPFVPEYLEARGFSAMSVGCVSSMQFVSALVSTPSTGSFVSITGPLYATVIALFLGAIGSSLLGASLLLGNGNRDVEFVILLLSRAIQGVGNSWLAVVSRSIVVDAIPPGDRSWAFAIMGGANGIGFIAGPITGAILFARFGFDGSFQVMAVILAFLAPVTPFTLYSSFQSSTGPRTTSTPAAWRNPAVASVLYIFGAANVINILTVCAVGLEFDALYSIDMEAMMEYDRSWVDAATNTASTASGLCTGLSSVLYVASAPIIGKLTMPYCLGPMFVFIGGAFIGGCACIVVGLVIALIPTVSVRVIAFTIWFSVFRVSQLAVQAPSVDLAIRAAPESSAVEIATLNVLAMTAGATIGSFLGPVLFAHLDISMTHLLQGIMLLAGVVVAKFVVYWPEPVHSKKPISS